MKKSFLAIVAIAIIALLVVTISCKNGNLKPEEYEITIQFPDNYDYGEVAYLLNDGTGYSKSVSKPNQQTTTLSGKAHSAYVKLRIKLTDKNTHTLWVKSGEKAQIYVNTEDQFELTNVLTDNEIGIAGFQAQIKPFQESLQNFFKTNKELIDKGGDSISKAVSKEINKILYAKLDYVENSENKYHAFEVLKSELLESSLPVNQLEAAYIALPTDIKQYKDAKTVEKFFAGRKLKVGGKAPPVRVIDLDGKKINLAQTGVSKARLVQFWASWCSFCIAEMPNIKKIHEEFGGNNLDIVAVTLDSDSIAFDIARKKYKMNWTHVYGQDKAAKDFGFVALPSMALIAEDGTILYRKEGMRDESDFNDLKAAIKKTIK